MKKKFQNKSFEQNLVLQWRKVIIQCRLAARKDKQVTKEMLNYNKNIFM